MLITSARGMTLRALRTSSPISMPKQPSRQQRIQQRRRANKTHHTPEKAGTQVLNRDRRHATQDEREESRPRGQ
jgi:hypothetical protein